MYILGMIILIFFAIIGLCSFVSAALNMLYRSNDNGAVIIVKDISADNAEARLRRAARVALSERDFRLICICDDNNPALKICKTLQKEYPIIEIVSENEAKNIFENSSA